MKSKETRYDEAIREALIEEMLRDERVFLIGEDIGPSGGAFGVTRGLLEKFGGERVRETPISEETIIGTSVGAAIAGWRPVAEIMFNDFVTLAMDQIVNHASLLRYVSGGQLSVPIVIRVPICQGRTAGCQHAKSLISWFMHAPGLKICVPSTPYDAKGLLKTAIRDDDPVLYFEHVSLYGRRVTQQIPVEDYVIPFGEADVKREGTDVTVVAISLMVRDALRAAEELAKQGISVEVIDPRTLIPFDEEVVISSVKKTGRLVIAETDWKRGGVGGEIAAHIAEKAIYHLDAPIRRVGALDVPVPFNPTLENAVLPNQRLIVEAVKEVVG